MQLKWHKIDVVAETGYKPPFFAGSMLRGALGVALKQVVCINPAYRCEGCFAAEKCVYYDFYEKKNAFHSYRIVSSLGSDRLRFGIYLFEEAADRLPYVLSAIKKAFEESGLGREKERVKIASIRIGNRLVYDGESFASLAHIEPSGLDIGTLSSKAHLTFNLPLRMKSENRLAREVSLPTLISGIHARYRAIKGLSPQKLGYKIRGEITSQRMRHLDLYRYSNRQRTRMKLGGLIGEMTLEGLDKQTAAYLKIGEIIGAGKQTVFGLGDYRLNVMEGNR
ncbi:CRISPR system precrRNA processing endoribonuclease RAMP protein Cas6 [Hydrogenimonas cancrithermarum]|uniref:CRISPR-associated endoribonuclease Cas6 n=1 Tax=Hydrogenimonas cancrithermarum TaxID=2993563 RepID=A0ABM8FJY9_9BACT|nr:CRISPR system precrRNA processing endoribonuclease RAMP protein Cas6 [Hydrogenimonas cancrithermarum]BDY11956.1 CRISPR-associated endoribonuclease Cas6 [Hydrogenimonas cancrithermarum]